MTETPDISSFLFPELFQNAETFRAVLSDAGYTQEALAGILNLSGEQMRQNVDVVYHRVRENTPLNILVRLFWLGRKVVLADLTDFIPNLDLVSLASCGLIRQSNGFVQSIAKLSPYQNLILASDFGPEIRPNVQSDHVLGVGAASLTLANLTVRRPVSSALDLGCGAGIQAFLASLHADHITATDTNARALDFARLNSTFNSITNIEWRKGDLYEPVKGEQFDLIVCNPPYVISPESQFVYRDASLPGDGVSEHVIRGASDHLKDQGFACILFNWHHTDDQDWAVRPMQWILDCDCDAWLICFRTTDPITYASDWLSTSVRLNGDEFSRHLDEWLAYYDQMRIHRISAGSMILRRRTVGDHWTRADRFDHGRSLGSCSDQIQRVFAAEDFLQKADDRQLLCARLILDPHHLLEHKLHTENGRWILDDETLRASDGIGFSGTIDFFLGNLLAVMDGKTGLEDHIASVCDRLTFSYEEVVGPCLNAIRRLMRAGLVRSGL